MTDAQSEELIKSFFAEILDNEGKVQDIEDVNEFFKDDNYKKMTDCWEKLGTLLDNKSFSLKIFDNTSVISSKELKEKYCEFIVNVCKIIINNDRGYLLSDDVLGKIGDSGDFRMFLNTLDMRARMYNKLLTNGTGFANMALSFATVVKEEKEKEQQIKDYFDLVTKDEYKTIKTVIELKNNIDDVADKMENCWEAIKNNGDKEITIEGNKKIEQPQTKFLNSVYNVLDVINTSISNDLTQAEERFNTIKKTIEKINIKNIKFIDATHNEEVNLANRLTLIESNIKKAKAQTRLTELSNIKKDKEILDIFLQEKSFKEFKEVVETLLPETEEKGASEEKNKDNVRKVNSVINKLYEAIESELEKNDLTTEQLNNIQTIVINVNNYCYDKKEVFKNRIEANTGEKDAWSENLGKVEDDFKTNFIETIKEKKQQQIKKAEEFLKGIKAEEGQFTKENFNKLKESIKILLPDTKENGADKEKNTDNVDTVVKAVNDMCEVIKTECKDGEKNKNKWEETGKLIDNFKKYIEGDEFKNRIKNSASEKNKYENEIENKIKDLDKLKEIVKLKAEFNDKDLIKFAANGDKFYEVENDAIIIKEKLEKEQLDEYKNKIERIKKHNKDVEELKTHNDGLEDIVGEIVFKIVNIKDPDELIQAIDDNIKELEQKELKEKAEQEKQEIENKLKEFNTKNKIDEIDNINEIDEIDEIENKIKEIKNKVENFNTKFGKGGEYENVNNVEKIKNDEGEYETLIKYETKLNEKKASLEEAKKKKVEEEKKEEAKQALKNAEETLKKEIETQKAELGKINIEIADDKMNEGEVNNKIQQAEETINKAEEVIQQAKKTYKEAYNAAEDAKVDEIGDKPKNLEEFDEYKGDQGYKKASENANQKVKEAQEKLKEIKKKNLKAKVGEAEKELKETIAKKTEELKGIEVKVEEEANKVESYNSKIQEVNDKKNKAEQEIKQLYEKYKEAYQKAIEGKVGDEYIGENLKELDKIEEYDNYKREIDNLDNKIKKVTEEKNGILKNEVKKAEEELKEEIEKQAAEMEKLSQKTVVADDTEIKEKEKEIYLKEATEEKEKIEKEIQEKYKAYEEAFSKAEKEQVEGYKDKKVETLDKILTKEENQKYKYALDTVEGKITKVKQDKTKEEAKKQLKELDEELGEQSKKLEGLFKKEVMVHNTEAIVDNKITLEQLKQQKEDAVKAVDDKFKKLKETLEKIEGLKVDGKKVSEIELQDLKKEIEGIGKIENIENYNAQKGAVENKIKTAEGELQKTQLEDQLAKAVEEYDDNSLIKQLSKEIGIEENGELEENEKKIQEAEKTIGEVRKLIVQINRHNEQHKDSKIEIDEKDCNYKKLTGAVKTADNKVLEAKKQAYESAIKKQNESIKELQGCFSNKNVEDESKKEIIEKNIEKVKEVVEKSEDLIKKIETHNTSNKVYKIEESKEFKEFKQQLLTLEISVTEAQKKLEHKEGQNIEQEEDQTPPHLQQEIDGSGTGSTPSGSTVGSEASGSVAPSQEEVSNGGSQTPQNSQQEIDGSGTGSTPSASTVGGEASGSVTPPQEEVDSSGSSTPSQSTSDNSTQSHSEMSTPGMNGGGETPSPENEITKDNVQSIADELLKQVQGFTDDDKKDKINKVIYDFFKQYDLLDVSSGKIKDDKRTGLDLVISIITSIQKKELTGKTPQEELYSDWGGNKPKTLLLSNLKKIKTNESTIKADESGKITVESVTSSKQPSNPSTTQNSSAPNSLKKPSNPSTTQNSSAPNSLKKPSNPTNTPISPRGDKEIILKDLEKCVTGLKSKTGFKTFDIKNDSQQTGLINRLQKAQKNGVELTKDIVDNIKSFWNKGVTIGDNTKTIKEYIEDSGLLNYIESPSKEKEKQELKENITKYKKEIDNIISEIESESKKEPQDKTKLEEKKKQLEELKNKFEIAIGKYKTDCNIKDVTTVGDINVNETIDNIEKTLQEVEKKLVVHSPEGTNASPSQQQNQQTSNTSAQQQNQQTSNASAQGQNQPTNQQTNQQQEQQTEPKSNTTTKQKQQAKKAVGNKLNDKILPLMLMMQMMNKQGPGMNPMTMLLPMLLGGDNENGKINPMMMMLLLMMNTRSGGMANNPLMMFMMMKMMMEDQKEKDSSKATKTNKQLVSTSENLKRATETLNKGKERVAIGG